MWKFIVTWCILTEVVIPNKVEYDKYGRGSISTTLEYNYRLEEDCGHSKEFMCRENAFNFYNEAYKMQALDTIKWDDGEILILESEQNLRNVKIDSVYIDCAE